MNLWYNIKQLFYPKLCIGCMEKSLPQDQLLCITCNMDIPYTDHFTQTENKVVEHFYGRVDIAHGAAMLYFAKNNTVQNMLYNFKYKGEIYIGNTLGKAMGTKLLNCGHFPKIDMIIPIPIHISKLKRRGFNQATIIAEGIREVTGLPVRSDILIKLFDTSSQTHKSREERSDNVENTIGILHGNSIKGKHILIVDDVITTGATIEASALVLKKAGAISISVMVAGVSTRGWL